MKKNTKSAEGDFEGKKLFQKNGMPGPGRPKGSTTSNRSYLASLFVERTIAEWPDLVDTLFRMAKKENMKAISLIFEYAVSRPKNNIVLEETEKPDLDSVTKEQLIDILQRN